MRAASSEELAGGYESGMLEAMVAHAQGSVQLVGGEVPAALLSLRRAADLWQALEAPYEIARTRVLVGEAADCSAITRRPPSARGGAASSNAPRCEAGPGRLAARAPADAHGLSRRELECSASSLPGTATARSRPSS